MRSAENKAFLMPKRTGWVRHFSAGEILNVGFDSHTLICVFDPQAGVSVVALLPTSPVGLRDRLFEQIFLESKRVGLQVRKAIFKIVGSGADLDAIETALNSRQVHEVIRCVATGAGGEAVYYSSSGRLRVRYEDNEERTRKVLIVDDSPTMRKLLRRILSADPQLEVVGETGNPREVEALVERLRPDVVTLDINMPEIDGITLLHQLSGRFSIPAVMVSAVSYEQAYEVLKALELGAVDYIEKPQLSEIDAIAPLIREKVRTASRAVLRRPSRTTEIGPVLTLARSVDHPIVIGASTGGVEAIKQVLTRLPRNIPPIVIAQHIPRAFSKAFAQRLNDLCPFEVREAEEGDVLKSGLVLVAPGGFQTKVVSSGGERKIEIRERLSQEVFAPCIDELFISAARCCGKEVLGILLTGMGDDGANGLLEMLRCGAKTIAQDESTCVVFGMPRTAIEIGAVSEVLALGHIAERIVSWCQVQARAA